MAKTKGSEWSPDEEQRLVELRESGSEYDEIANFLNSEFHDNDGIFRTDSSVRWHLNKMQKKASKEGKAFSMKPGIAESPRVRRPRRKFLEKEATSKAKQPDIYKTATIPNNMTYEVHIKDNTGKTVMYFATNKDYIEIVEAVKKII